MSQAVCSRSGGGSLAFSPGCALSCHFIPHAMNEDHSAALNPKVEKRFDHLPRGALHRTPVLSGVLSISDERPLAIQSRKLPRGPERRGTQLGPGGSRPREGGAGLWGFPDARSHPTPGGSPKPALSSLSDQRAGLPPAAATCGHPALSAPAGKRARGPSGSDSGGGLLELWAGARMTSRGPLSAGCVAGVGKLEVRAEVSPGQDGEQGPRTGGDVSQSRSSLFCHQVQEAASGEGEGDPG